MFLISSNPKKVKKRTFIHAVPPSLLDAFSGSPALIFIHLCFKLPIINQTILGQIQIGFFFNYFVFHDEHVLSSFHVISSYLLFFICSRSCV